MAVRMAEPLSVAVLGSGIGADHCDAYARMPDLFRVDVVVDHAQARAMALAARMGATTVLRDAEALFEAGRRFDIVDICLPPGAHRACIDSALAHGAHVVCEKPVLDSLSALDAVAEAARAAGRAVMPIFNCRFGHGFRALQALVAGGLAGAPVAGHLAVQWERDEAYFAARWRRSRAGSFGGVLAAQSIHHLDMATELMGEPVRVGAVTRAAFGHEIEDTAALWCETQSGALIALSATLAAAGNRSEACFVYEHLTARSDGPATRPGKEPWTFAARLPERQPAIDAALARFRAGPEGAAAEDFEGQLRAFHAALAGHGPLPVTLADARRSAALLTAAYKSAAAGGAPVSLPIDPADPAFAHWPARRQGA